ncbi:MAG: hypothetical protein EBZ48_03380 [Proteobacteria bacterium]|nr:hypothetical protein [Pseudomonadota bacterium]
MTHSITLEFQTVPELRLLTTSISSANKAVRQAVLQLPGGGTHGLSFTWCPSVKIAAFLLTLAAAKARGGSRTHPLAVSRGSQFSPLASGLNTKGGALSSIFGSDESTDWALPAEIFIPTNLRQRRPGPVAVTIDDAVLPWDRISIILDQKSITTEQSLSALAQRLGALIGFDAALHHPQAA